MLLITLIAPPRDTSPTSFLLPPYLSTLDLSLIHIKGEQHSDPSILPIIQRLRENLSHSRYALRDNILFRIVFGGNTTSSSHVPYLPTSLIPLVLNLYYDHPLSGHFGVCRMLSSIRDKIRWPDMHVCIQNYVASCTQCARHNILRTKPLGHLKSIQPPSTVFQILHMDFWGPMRTPSACSNRYMIVFIENLSKYVIA